MNRTSCAGAHQHSDAVSATGIRPAGGSNVPPVDGRSILPAGGGSVDWHGKPYYSLDAWCKNTYGRKLYKVALDAGCTCPNRDGTLGAGGCIFCSAGGSGDFAVRGDSIRKQLDAGKRLLDPKWRTADTQRKEPPPCQPVPKLSCQPVSELSRLSASELSCPPAMASYAKGPVLIAYFQSYTNTYGDPDRLCRLFSDALSQPDVAGISIATRPDCLGDGILRRLSALKEAFPDKFIWIELGLQTIHDRTAAFIRRGYETAVFENTMQTLNGLGFPVIVHTILGLPGESKEDVLATMRALNALNPFGIKLQLLHILKGTDLADLYESGKVNALTKEAYVELVTDCIAALSPSICIHRITGDGPKSLLLAPDWSRNKRDVLNSIHSCMKQKGVRQGQALCGCGQDAACFREGHAQTVTGVTHHESGTTDPL